MSARGRSVAVGRPSDRRHDAADPAAPSHAAPRVLLDERGNAYRVLRVERSMAADGTPHLVLRVARTGPAASAVGASYGLTPREAHIAVRLARRATTAEIAEELEISPHTVRHHTERVLAKLGVRSREAVRRTLFDGASDR